MPILIVARIEPGLAGILVGYRPLLPGLETSRDRIDVGAGAQLHVDITVLAAPAFQRLGRVVIVGDEIDPEQAVDPEMRIARNIAQDSGDPEIARDAARDQGNGPADDIVRAEASASLCLGDDRGVDLIKGIRVAANQGKRNHVEKIAVDEQIVFGGRGSALVDEDGIVVVDVNFLLDLREAVLERLARCVRRHLQLGFLPGVARLEPGLDLKGPIAFRDPAIVTHLVAHVE